MNFASPASFCAPSNWQSVKTPNNVSGTVVIESDDGMDGDYTNWLPIFLRKKGQYLQWFPSPHLTFVPDVNTAIIGQTGRMTSANLQTLNSYQFEIMSHGRHHAGVGKYALLANAESGAAILQVAGTNLGFDGSFEMYDYKIYDDSHVEYFSITAKNGNAISISPALSNSYIVGEAFVELTESSMRELLQGAIDDLAELGIQCDGYVYTFHSGSQHDYNQNAVDLIMTLYSSARGVLGGANYQGDDLWKLKAQGLSDALPYETIDSILNTASSTDAIAIFYGHGEKTAAIQARLEHIIDGCMSRGIKITTRREAVKKLTQGNT